MIKRLPLILFILTLASGAAMILIRINGSGIKLLSAKTGTGRFIAATYNSCVIVFVIILIAFIIVTVILNKKRKKRKAAAPESTVSPVDTGLPAGNLPDMLPAGTYTDNTQTAGLYSGEPISEEYPGDVFPQESAAGTARPQEILTDAAQAPEEYDTMAENAYSDSMQSEDADKAAKNSGGKKHGLPLLRKFGKKR